MTEERDIRINRQKKMEEWLDSSEGYTNSFRRDNSAIELHEKYQDIDKSKLENLSHEASVCGRVMFKRVMGKASFISIQDTSGQIQCYLNKEKLGEQKYANTLSLLDVGDIVGVFGGYLICVYVLSFNPEVFLVNVFNFVEFVDVFSGLVKASVFGLIITFMGCYHGFHARGGAQGVGLATTYSVVSSSIMILLFNYILTSLFFQI